MKSEEAVATKPDDTLATADLARADGLVGRVLAALPRSALAHFAKGTVLRAQRRCEEAIPEQETALASDRNIAGMPMASQMQLP